MLNQKNLLTKILFSLIIAASFTGCSKTDSEGPASTLPPQQGKGIQGLYILCEGSFGASNASLDYYDFEGDTLYREVFKKANPQIVKGLGDIGNDVAIYGTKMYLVINNSNKVEVVDAQTVKSIKTIDLPEGRYITFHSGKAYVTSNEGFVALIDTTTLEIEDTAHVGRNPEQLAVVNDRLYVANSGGYSAPDYDSTLSVIDLNTFEEVNRIKVDLNLQRVVPDNQGNLYVSSLGNYEDVPSNLYVIDTKTNAIKKTFNTGASNIAIHGDSAYVYQYEFDYNTGENTKSYTLINTRTEDIITRHFIPEEAEDKINVPYGLTIRPDNGNIFISDAKDYQSPGTLYCFDREGNLQWEGTTGVSPSGFAFLIRRD